VDQTSQRSSKTKLITIQPPPLPGIYKVPGSGSLFAWEPGKVIRQALHFENLDFFYAMLKRVGIWKKAS